MMKILILFLIPMVCWGQSKTLFKNDTLTIESQMLNGSEIITITEKMSYGAYKLRTAKHTVRSKDTSTPGETTWALGGRQILFIDRKLLLLCEDRPEGLKCLTLDK